MGCKKAQCNAMVVDQHLPNHIPHVAKSTIRLAVAVPGVAATLAGIRRAIKLEQNTTAHTQKTLDF